MAGLDNHLFQENALTSSNMSWGKHGLSYIISQILVVNFPIIMLDQNFHQINTRKYMNR